MRSFNMHQPKSLQHLHPYAWRNMMCKNKKTSRSPFLPAMLYVLEQTQRSDVSMFPLNRLHPTKNFASVLFAEVTKVSSTPFRHHREREGPIIKVL